MRLQQLDQRCNVLDPRRDACQESVRYIRRDHAKGDAQIEEGENGAREIDSGIIDRVTEIHTLVSEYGTTVFRFLEFVYVRGNQD